MILAGRVVRLVASKRAPRGARYFMDINLIATLCAHDPRQKRLPVSAPSRQPMDIADEARAKFIATYSNPAYGWDISMAYASARVVLPATLNGRDHWLFKAYLMRIDSRRWRDADVMGAWALANLVESRSLKTKVCSLLLSGCGKDPDKHRRAVAEAASIPFRVLEAFDTLFYNVLDRAADAAYLSEQVFPHTRYVSIAEDYLKITGIADLVKRASYNHRDLEMSTYLAGFGDESFMAKLSARSDREQELTRHLMGNALMLVHAGALNQRSIGLQRAQGLIAASRQSGPTIETPAIADASIFMADALKTALAAHSDQRVKIAVEDAGG